MLEMLTTSLFSFLSTILGTLPALFGQLPPGSSFWFPPAASNVAEGIDWVFYFILYLCLFFFVLITGLMLAFMWLYRRREGVPALGGPSHNNALEIAWSVIPSFLLVYLFYVGFVGYLDLRTVPEEAYEIQVNAKKWAWAFTYPGDISTNELHLPVNQDVRLVMNSTDVIHSLYVPAFRTKMDVVPGRYTKMWMNATKKGEYKLFCTEYCGEKHSAMLAKVVVEDWGEFEKWLAKEGDLVGNYGYEKAGEMLYQRKGCNQCHSIDGSAMKGPTFKGAFGKEREIEGQSEKVVMDENYIRESILNPQAKIHKGYPAVMPTFQGQIKDEEINAIIAYLKTLK
ncbi:Cytochrome c oxidase subunit II [Planctomycetales bacterium 10988]|nr:Cytochrome c oxidase subunit II [Planctomycetales bacterium 10988]